MASLGIIHRDFKIANIFISKGVAKLADFGFAYKLKHGNERFHDVNIGSPVYMAPEALINNLYGPKTDTWAFGVFVFEILHGDTPLGYCETEEELSIGSRKQISVNRLNPSIHALLKDLVIKCLQVDENRRLTVAQICAEPYMIQLAKEFGGYQLADTNPSLITTSLAKNLPTQQMSSSNLHSTLHHLNMPVK